MPFLSSSSAQRPLLNRTARLLTLAALAATLGAPLASCQKDSDSSSPSLVQPTSAKPSYAPNENDQMWAVIDSSFPLMTRR